MSAYIITVASHKGGVGKTLTCSNLGYKLHKDGHKVLMIDSDPQASLFDWYCSRDDKDRPPVVKITEPVIHQQIEQFKNNYDFIIVDTQPTGNKVVQSALVRADLAILPIKPSAFDFRSLKHSIALINNVKEFSNPNLKVRILINLAKSNRVLSQNIISQLQDFDYPVFKTNIHDRIAFEEASMLGIGVVGYGDKKAHMEVEGLTKEIQNG